MEAHAPSTWKTATVRSLVKRAFTICSDETLLLTELQHLKSVFTKYNNYSPNVIDHIIQKESNNSTPTNSTPAVETNQPPPTIVSLFLPYAGQKGNNLITKMKKIINSTIPDTNNTKMQTIYTTKKLGSRFPVKDQIKHQHQHNLVYHAICPEPQCTSHYTGQTKCRLLKRTIQHNNTNTIIPTKNRTFSFMPTTPNTTMSG